MSFLEFFVSEGSLDWNWKLLSASGKRSESDSLGSEGTVGSDFSSERVVCIINAEEQVRNECHDWHDCSAGERQPKAMTIADRIAITPQLDNY